MIGSALSPADRCALERSLFFGQNTTQSILYLFVFDTMANINASDTKGYLKGTQNPLGDGINA